LTSSPDILFGLPALSTDIGLYIEFVLAGLNGFPGDVVAEAIEPNLPMGKFSTIGDNALGSKETFLGEVMTPSKPKPAVWLSSSGGGVGVRGGSGIGNPLDMAEDKGINYET